ncbi:expressed protein [Phakopsora pachyrhizi]|uniref:Expressed protein n=1 Tax=Phakopsora pachyrhizi TaxID=170000 RepID=A0AAV0AGU1_PHAPC|nr:expressed protein [Phakopsora pachyrhizi]
MTTGVERSGTTVSSILVEMRLEGGRYSECGEEEEEKERMIYLIDPFVPLLRGFDRSNNHRVCVSRPPSKPYIDARSEERWIDEEQGEQAFESNGRRWRRRRRRRSKHMSHSGSDLRRQRLGLSDQGEDPLRGIESLERVHHQSIKADLELAIESIRRRWIEICSESKNLEWWSDQESYKHRLMWIDHHRKEKPSSSTTTTTDLNVPPDWTEICRNQSIGEYILLLYSELIPEHHLTLSISHTTIIKTKSKCRVKTIDFRKSCDEDQEMYPIHLPDMTSFSLTTLDNFTEEIRGLNNRDGWDVVIIEYSIPLSSENETTTGPPWENESAKRSKSYRSIELYELFKVNLKASLSLNSNKKSLVLIWVTNRPKFRRFLKNKFMPDSNIVGPYREWYWLKITSSPLIPPDCETAIKDRGNSPDPTEADDDKGESVRIRSTVGANEKSVRSLVLGGKPIFDLNSSSPRRSYEGLILGWYLPDPLKKEYDARNDVGGGLPELKSKIFLSVPLSHSRKPNLLDLIEEYVPPNPKVLELFARSVTGFKTEEYPEGGSLRSNEVDRFTGDSHNLSNLISNLKSLESDRPRWHSIGDESPKFNGPPHIIYSEGA